MGKILLKFEDRFGMHVIVNRLLGRDISYDGHYFVGDICIQHSYGSPYCFVIDADTLSICREENISEIIVICDTDSITGHGILTPEELDKYLAECVVPSDIDVKYLPVAWCAETLLLYQFMDIQDAEVYTIPKRIKKKLKSLIKEDVNVKKTDSILVPSLLKMALDSLDADTLLDKEIINYLLEREYKPMTLSEFKDWLMLAQEKFDNNYGWWSEERI